MIVIIIKTVRAHHLFLMIMVIILSRLAGSLGEGEYLEISKNKIFKKMKKRKECRILKYKNHGDNLDQASKLTRRGGIPKC